MSGGKYAKQASATSSVAGPHHEAVCHPRDASYYQSVDCCDPLSLQLHQTESGRPGCMDVQDDEGDNLAGWRWSFQTTD
jgi:hypothetical protein